MTAREGTGGRNLAVTTGGSGGAQGADKLDGGLGGKVLVVVVVDLNHGGVDAGAEALDLNKCEKAVGSGLALLNTKLLLEGLDNNVGAAAAELARGLQIDIRLAGVNANIRGHKLKRTVVQAWTKNLPTGVRLYMV